MHGMTDQPDQPDQAEIRASDAERQSAATRLNDAVGEGRLTLEEFSQRVDAAYGAKTRGELERVVSDLPAARTAADPPAVVGGGHASPRPQWSVSLIGGTSRRGRWRVPQRAVSVSVIGGNDLDLREAELAAPEVEMITVSVIGGVSLKVPRGVRVVVEGFSLLGGRSIRLDEAAIAPSAPTIRLKAFSLIGGISVRNP
jgi:Domain of unknown function (DUF1707)